MPLPSSSPHRGGYSAFGCAVLLAALAIVVLLFIAPNSPFRPNFTNPFVQPTPVHHSGKPAVRVYSQTAQYYVNLARQDAAGAGISPDLFVRQINEESGFNPNAVSPKGAIGIAQFMPGTAAGLGINPWDPVQSLRGAARLMANYARRYGSYAMALAAYNAGSGSLQAALNACGASWQSCLPAETQAYIHIILG